MKTLIVMMAVVLTVSSPAVFAQRLADKQFMDVRGFYKDVLGPPVAITNNYDEIEGTPYLNKDFTEGAVYLKDTTAVKVPLRYNIYTDELEYRMKDVNYAVGNPQALNKAVIGGSVFVYLPFVGKGGYFELLESGKCFLVQKRSVTFKPSEDPKPIEGKDIPARFVADPDVFYMVVENAQPVEITGMKSVLSTLADQKDKVGSYVKAEGLKTSKKENLIKIAKYYNSL
jgi:hypothetical protein